MTARQTDVVVVGAGLAGLACANRAAQLGKTVLVLEKGTGEEYACSSRIATGVLNVAHTDPTSDPAVLRRSIAEDTEGYADPALADALAANAGRAVRWLQEQGVQLENDPAKRRWSFAPAMRADPAHHWRGRGADVAMNKLAEICRSRATLLTGQRARRLLMREGRCAGVEADGLVVEAKHVVLADGGFQGNPELVRRFVSQHPERLVQRSAGTACGDALLMAEAVGAKLTEASCFYGHLLVHEALANGRLWPYPTIDSLASSAVVVDAGGRRFLDEGLGGIPMSNALARLDDPLSATAIFDHAIWESAGRREMIAPNPHMEPLGGTLHRAQTIEELAGRIGVPAQPLAETLRAYNEALENGRPGTLVPGRTPGRGFGTIRSSPDRLPVRPVKTAPFYAIRLAAGLTFTMGGIATDAGARVLDTDGVPIAGLYAAGSCTGGLEGGPIAGYVGGLVRALVFGLIAAESIASS